MYGFIVGGGVLLPNHYFPTQLFEISDVKTGVAFMASALHRSQHQLRTAEEGLTFDSCLHKTQKCNISPALAARFRRAQSHECHTCIGLQLSEKFKGSVGFRIVSSESKKIRL